MPTGRSTGLDKVRGKHGDRGQEAVDHHKGDGGRGCSVECSCGVQLGKGSLELWNSELLEWSF